MVRRLSLRSLRSLWLWFWQTPEQFLKARLRAQRRQIFVGFVGLAIGEAFGDGAGQGLERFVFLSEFRVSAGEIEVSDSARVRARRDARFKRLEVGFDGFFIAPGVELRGGELPVNEAVAHARLDSARQQRDRLFIL